MKKTFLFGLLVFLLALYFIGCGGDDESFIAVTDITLAEVTYNYIGIPLGNTLTLNGIIEPTNASNKTITWVMKNDNGASVTLEGNSLIIGETSIGNGWGGGIFITAIIPNGKEEGIPFTKDFEIKINNYNPQTNKLYLTMHGETGSWQTLGMPHYCLFVKDFYNGTITKNTSYKIKIGGNLNNSLANLRISIENIINGNQVSFGEAIQAGDVTNGNLNIEKIFQTKNETFDTALPENAMLLLNSDLDSFSNENQGKVGAIISNFSLTIEEVTE